MAYREGKRAKKGIFKSTTEGKWRKIGRKMEKKAKSAS